MKKINKKIIFIVITVALVIALALFITLNIFNKNKEETPVVNQYNAYINIDALVKLSFSVSCKEDKCDNPVVDDYVLVNDKAKDIFNEIDVKNKELSDVLSLLVDIAKDKNVSFEKIDYYTDWNNKKYWKDNEYFDILNIVITSKKDLDKYVKEHVKNKYEVSFDSDGGSAVSAQTVEEGSKVSVPPTPTKDGYKFIEWQLDGKAYDFNLLVTKNIVLKAKWEQVVEENNSSSQNVQPSKGQSSNNSHSTNTPSQNNNQSQNTKPPVTTTKYNYVGRYISLRFDSTLDPEHYMLLNADGTYFINGTNYGPASGIYKISTCSNPASCDVLVKFITICEKDGSFCDSHTFSFKIENGKYIISHPTAGHPDGSMSYADFVKQ